MKPTKNIFMIRPANFGFNSETAESNHFQNKLTSSIIDTTQKARAEFDLMVELLTQKGIFVEVIEDTSTPIKPDAVFPNNWISTHKDGTIYLYPMAATNRRLERREDVVDLLKRKFHAPKVVDLSYTESQNRYLEGTGSIVFDHRNKTAFACLSPRTEEDLFTYFCHEIDYQPIHFKALDKYSNEIYHTNVMMCVGEKFAVICLESIVESEEKNQLINHFQNYNKSIIEITLEQMNCFAGNMIELNNTDGRSIIVLSQSAYNSLSPEQTNKLSQFGELLPISIPTIEKIGGGSVRCMIAENFLTLK